MCIFYNIHLYWIHTAKNFNCMYDTRECNLFILQTPANRKYSKGLIIRLLCCICVLVYLYISISVFVHWTLGNIIFVILEPPALQINTQCFKTHKSGTLQIKNFGPKHQMDNSEKTTFLVVFTKFYAPLLMCWPCWYTDKLILLMRWSCWCTDPAGALMLLMLLNQDQDLSTAICSSFLLKHLSLYWVRAPDSGVLKVLQIVGGHFAPPFSPSPQIKSLDPLI